MVLIDNTPPIADFRIYKGDSFVKAFRVKNRSTRQLVDLTGATARMQLRATPASNDILYTFNLSIDTALSTITASILDWSGIAWTTGSYDLEVAYAGGIVDTLCRGTITVEGDTSR
jgi:hypothetical protein